MIVSLQRPKACAEKRIRYPLSAHQIGQDERLPSLETCHAPSCPIVLRYAMEHYNLEKDIASDLKEQFELECPNFADGGTQHKTCRTLWTVARHSTADSRYGPTWHCLVGRHFSSYAGSPGSFRSFTSAFHRQKMNTCCHLLIFIASGHARKELLLPLGRQILADFF